MIPPFLFCGAHMDLSESLVSRSRKRKCRNARTSLSRHDALVLTWKYSWLFLDAVVPCLSRITQGEYFIHAIDGSLVSVKSSSPKYYNASSKYNKYAFICRSEYVPVFK